MTDTLDDKLPQKKLPFVWELNNHGIISYAIGTMHVMKDQYGEDISHYVNKAQQLLVERTCADIKKDPPLFVIPPEDLQEAARALTIDLGALAKLPAEHHIGYILFGTAHQNYRGIDFVLQDRARGIPHYSLETPAERAEAIAFSDVPQKVRTLIEAERKNPGDAKKIFAGTKLAAELMMDTYESGSMTRAEFLETLRNNLGNNGAKENLIKRNHIMAERAIPHLEKPSIFAVGIAHYLGDNSVLQAFTEKGITIARV